MREGPRNCRIVIRPVTITRNALGTEVEDHESAAPLNAWAGVTYGTGQERREASAREASQRATFRVRYNPARWAIDPRSVIDFDGMRWGITGKVRVGTRREDIEFTAVARH